MLSLLHACSALAPAADLYTLFMGIVELQSGRDALASARSPARAVCDQQRRHCGVEQAVRRHR